MKYTLLISFLFVFVFANAQDKKNYVLFSGNIKNTSEVSFKIGNHDNSFLKNIKISSNGDFSDTLRVPEAGTYSYQIGKSYTSIFLKPGDNLRLDIDYNDFFKTIKYSGEGSVLNNYIATYNALMTKLTGEPKAFFMVPLTDFLAKIQSNKEEALAQLAKSKLTESDKQLQRDVIEDSFLLTRNNFDKFNHYHTGTHPVLPKNYNDLVKNFNLDNEYLYKNDRNFRVLVTENFYITSKEAMVENPNLSIVDFVKNKVSNIKSVLVREAIVSMLFRQMNLDNENYQQDYEEILALLATDNMKKKLTERYNAVGKTKPAMAAYNFDYENFKGGNTKLSELKGKIIYVEIWATWCGPCIREQPALSQLIKDFKGQNVEFVSVSIDSKQDYGKWRAMVAKSNIGGIQLFSDKGLESDFMKAFAVGLIPRSIMLDETGKIVTPHAPRPSDKTTKAFIQNLLDKNNL